MNERNENEEKKEVNNGRKKSIPLVLLIIIILLIGVIIGLVVALIKSNKAPKGNANNVISETNTDSTNTERIEANAVNNELNAIENLNTETQDNKENTEEISIAAAEIRKCLKDEDWIKQNVSIEIGESYPQNQPQSHKFFVTKDSDGNPLVVVKAIRDDGQNSIQAFMVAYKDGNVAASEVSNLVLPTKDTKTTIKIDPDNALVCFYEDLINGEQNSIYSVKEGVSSKLDVYGFYEGGEHEGKWFFKEEFWRGVPTIEEEEYEIIKDKYTSNTFFDVSTELTDANIDKYIK